MQQGGTTTSATARWLDAAAQVLIGGTAIVAMYIAWTGSPAPVHGAQAQDRYRRAMAAYEAQQWPQAYAQLSAAADAGDPAAARVATMMARQGPLLFGRRFDVNPERLQRWELAMRGQWPVAPAPAVTSRETGARTGDSPPDVQVARAR